MKISSELIKELKKRIDVSYEEAEYFLKKAKKDIDYAEYLVKKKRNSSWNNNRKKVSKLFGNIFTYRMTITRKDELLLNLPVVIIIMLLVLMSPMELGFYILIFAVLLLTECELKIIRHNKKIDETEENIIYKYHTEDVKAEERTNINVEKTFKNEYDVNKNSSREINKEYRKESNKEVLDSKKVNDVNDKVDSHISNNIVKETNLSDNKVNKKDDEYYEIIIKE